MRFWYLSDIRAVNAQASLHIRAVSPEPSFLWHRKEGCKKVIFRERDMYQSIMNWL